MGRTKQCGTETFGDLWKGAGWDGVRKMNTTLSGRKARNLKEVGLGWTNGRREDNGLDGGRYEMVVNSCFEDLEGKVGLRRVWEFVKEAGKKRNLRVKVSSNS